MYTVKEFEVPQMKKCFSLFGKLACNAVYKEILSFMDVCVCVYPRTPCLVTLTFAKFSKNVKYSDTCIFSTSKKCANDIILLST